VTRHHIKGALIGAILALLVATMGNAFTAGMAARTTGEIQ